MDFKKSVTKALAMKQCTATSLYNSLGVTKQTYYATLNSNQPSAENLEKYAKFFGMKVSEFIELGE